MIEVETSYTIDGQNQTTIKYGGLMEAKKYEI